MNRYQWMVVVGWLVMIVGAFAVMLGDIFALETNDVLAALLIIGGMGATVIGDRKYEKMRNDG
jgi:hypothetical protein